jgi:hypothetical protein
LLDVRGPFGFDARQLQLVPQDFREFVQRNIDLHDMGAGVATCGSGSVPFIVSPRDRLTDFAFPLTHAAAPILAVTEMGNVELREWDADKIASLPADHFAVSDVFLQVLADLAADDFFEPRPIPIDFHTHSNPQSRSG